MSNLKISRAHQLGEGECRVAAESLLDKLVEKMGGSYAPSGQCYEYKHTSGLKAVVEPNDDELVINVKLGLMTMGLKPMLDREINKQLDEHFG